MNDTLVFFDADPAAPGCAAYVYLWHGNHIATFVNWDNPMTFREAKEFASFEGAIKERLEKMGYERIGEPTLELLHKLVVQNVRLYLKMFEDFDAIGKEQESDSA